MKKEKTRIRPVLSLTLFNSFFLSLLSGIALYLRPEGDLARRINWTWLGLDKKNWESIHIGVVLLLLISGIWHTLLNWKPLWGYLRSRGAKLKLHWRTVFIALLLTLLFSFGALWNIPPFSSLNQLRSVIKNGAFLH